MKQIIGFTLVIFGLMAVAGSAGDCDGKCMEYANTIPQMLMIIGGGITAIALGATLVWNSVWE
jgi:uncharacterized membrane protein YgdD (TMEM256/DUF423 family)